jgi:phthalate 4,5-cis-dihydrodiol dehydrogenase
VKDEGTFGLGLVGLGGATKQMLPSIISHPHFRIVAAADPRPEARASFAATFTAPVYEVSEQLCRDPNVDVVYIGAPHRFHKTIAVTAAECGKHVIVEKPMAMTIPECDAMIDTSQHFGVHLIVGHTHGFDLPVKKAREIIVSGQVGKPTMINTMNFNNYLYRPRWGDELKTELGGGVIYNQVPHQADIVRALGGGLVKSVRAMTWSHDPARPTEGSHLTFLQFEDGCAASMALSAYDFFDTDELQGWVGELGNEKRSAQHGSARENLLKLGRQQAEWSVKSMSTYDGANGLPKPPKGALNHPHYGLLLVSCTDGDIRPMPDGVNVYDRNGWRKICLPQPRSYPDKSAVLDEMHFSITASVTPPHDGRWGKATLEVCDAIRVSARERREVELVHQVSFRDQHP